MKKIERLDRLIGIVVLCLVIIASLIIGLRIWQKNRGAVAARPDREMSTREMPTGETPNREVPAGEMPDRTGSAGLNTDAASPATDAAPSAGPVAGGVAAAAPGPPRVIDYGKLKNDSATQALMQQRKNDIGVYEGIDIVAKPDETIKIGAAAVSMQRILDQIRLKEGEIVEKDLTPPQTPPETRMRGNETFRDIGAKTPAAADEVYGIHIVRPGDNIWNIHFTFLKSYFDHRGIRLSPISDEPDAHGTSSGVGRLLKFSERMVYIYNLRVHRIENNLDLIHPLSKIVIFRMKQVFTLLDQIDFARINRIQFDGETLWLPAS